MEKVMSVEEKIKRAEEIYNRRNGNSYINTATRSNEKKRPSFTHKMIKQIIICFIVYGIFYVVSNKEYFMSQEFQVKAQSVAEKNEYLNNTYNYIKNYLEKYITEEQKNNDNEKQETSLDEQTNNNEDAEKINSVGKNDDTNNENRAEQNNDQNDGIEKIKDNEENKNAETLKSNNENENTNIENVKSNNENENTNIENIKNNNENEGTLDLKNNNENIGGAETVANEEKTQEQKDIEEIKSTISFITPVQGKISSTFGWRTPTTATVPKYHTGLDIASATGTIIKSATNGKIILASSEGDYGKHYKIQINDITIIYAHCSKLYLKEGDEVTQGQQIAEVGSTGNSTRTSSAF